MRKTAILNLKGGVGKTTTAIHMAQMLSKHRHASVLLIDCDPQCNLSQYFEDSPKLFGSVSNVLVTGSVPYAVNTILPTARAGIHIIPADETLMELDLSQLKTDKVKPMIFRQLVKHLADCKLYDYVIFDCPPAFNAACAAALMAADDVVVPIKLDAFSVLGMTNVLRQIQNMRKLNPDLKVAGILPTMYYPAPAIAEAEDIIKRSGLHVYHHIRRSNHMDKSTFDRDLSSGKTGHMRDYRLFVAEYAEQEKRHGDC